MSISSVTQTITSPPVTPAATSSPSAAFLAASTAAGTGSANSLSRNPIGSLSSDMQSYLLQQQSKGSSGTQASPAHHRHGHNGGTHVDAPNLPGGTPSAVTA